MAKYVDIDKLMSPRTQTEYWMYDQGEIQEFLQKVKEEFPDEDVQPVIRCKNCIYASTHIYVSRHDIVPKGGVFCNYCENIFDKEHYCSEGKTIKGLI